ncbi:MAG: SusC/RagA family TonB-linked outer membrane protein, partial [Prevotella sp.]|nr:SusC/RagA family TonB-linked outer membrane protein [Prevotella sp.]
MAGLQAQTVSGSVYDANGEPLISVTVSVKGTTAGTMTDIDGNFKLAAKSGATILFKYLGYKDKEVKVTGATLGRIVMDDSSSSLDEVVVVGYGTQRKRDVSGAISSVTAKWIEERNPLNVQEALQGAVAGMLVTAASGEPGTEASIAVRGISTFENDYGPLYVVDGVIMNDISSINPNDIIRMEVVKDAATASIYGARGGSGVVLITTKSGAEGKPKITVRYLNTYGTLANKLPQLNREEREIFDNTVVSASSKNQFQWFKSSNDTVNLQARTSNDYQEIISRVAVRNDATISMQTGTDKFSVYASLGVLDDKGIILTSYNTRYTGRLKSIYTLSPSVKFTTNVTAGYQVGNSINEGSTFYNAIRRPTQSILYFPDGTLVNRYESNPSGKRNPLGELYDYENITKKYSALLNQIVEIKFAKYFTLNGSASANIVYSDNNTYSGPNIQAASADDLQKGVDKGTETVKFATDVLLESYLRYSRSFNRQHNLEVMAGLSTQQKESVMPAQLT